LGNVIKMTKLEKMTKEEEDLNAGVTRDKFGNVVSEETVSDRWPEYTPEELKAEQELADFCEKFKEKDE